ncbi:hypothetical protein [Opacimonas viscosa]|uniref:Uncharacterized protein n=1 Tax=Opacimonas viscosa TaxID=2961944 RepID=A0AA41X0G7_9ALTE|nr:hypothetical protein [Opacimonas viscosa]MCP3427713.1 hypothetical protein [Opacimonas viscosa]
MIERPYLLSGRNTIIHKVRKYDLLIINGMEHPALLVTHRGITEFSGRVPETKRDAKMQDMEMVDISSAEVFGDEKTLLFVQTINGKEYKIDYSKIGTEHFMKMHQASIF